MLQVSCDRAIHRAEKVSNKIRSKTTAVAKKQVQKIVDKILPTFDSDIPDTENNKLRFRDFIKVPLSKDVDSIFCFDDAVGIDADYMFSFNCNSNTSNSIISEHDLSIDTINLDNGFGLQHDFDWWKKDEIPKLQKYSWSNGNGLQKYFWFNDKKSKAYYFEFSM